LENLLTRIKHTS